MSRSVAASSCFLRLSNVFHAESSNKNDDDLSQWRTQKNFMLGVHSVAYGGHLYLVCAVSDGTI